MTYCVGMKLKSGMLFASDSRTNAGVDNVARFNKMHVFQQDGERLIVMMTAGNLSLTQSAINQLELANRSGSSVASVMNAASMVDVMMLLGDALRAVREREAPYLIKNNIDAGCSFIVGGQIRGERQRLFLLYSEGNFIEASDETPYFQIGEVKYGKPIIDRVVNENTTLPDAVKCTLVSFDSTMRSNVSVGLPIELLTSEVNTQHVAVRRRIVESDEYFQMIHTQWGEGLRKVFTALPNPLWFGGSDGDTSA